MTEANTPEENFEPLPEVKQFANYAASDQSRDTEKIVFLIDLDSADDWEKAANYFVILKLRKFSAHTTLASQRVVRVAKKIPSGSELNLMKIFNKEDLKNIMSAIISILNSIARSDEITKNNFDIIKNTVNAFFDKSYDKKKNELPEQNLSEQISDNQKENFDDDIKKASGFITGLMQNLQGEQEKIKKSKEEFEQKTQEALEGLQRTINIDIFANEAEIFRNAARRYFITAMAFLVLAVTSVGSLFYIARFVLDETTYNLKSITVGNTLLVVLLLSLLGIGMRGYFLNSHNEVHNRHRSNVLRSYKNIYENTKEKDRKEVVTQTLSAAFQQLPTGFSKQQGDGGVGGFASFMSRFLP